MKYSDTELTYEEFLKGQKIREYKENKKKSKSQLKNKKSDTVI